MENQPSSSLRTVADNALVRLIAIQDTCPLVCERSRMDPAIETSRLHVQLGSANGLWRVSLAWSRYQAGTIASLRLFRCSSPALGWK